MATSEKIQLKGAAQYKKDLQQIVAQSKALSSEMKMVKSSFDKSTSAEQKNEAITKQLNKQIETQKAYVDKLRQAYEAEVAASGEQSVAALKAKDALMKGQTVLNDMERENRELAQAEDEESAAAQRNEGAHSKLNGVLKAAGAAIGAVAAATAAAAKALWDCANAAGNWADSMLTMSAQTGVAVETLQKWDYAARFIDVDSETMAKALAKVTAAQGNAIKNGNDYVTMLDGQVIALKDANGEYKSSEEVFYSMIDALGQIGDATMQDAAAQDLFGKSFQELKPLIAAGSEGLNALGKEAEDAGLILSGDAVSSLGAFDDEMERFSATISTAGKQLALSFLPATQQVAESLTDLAQTVTKSLSDGFQEMDADVILEALFDKLSKGFQNISAVMPAIAKFVAGLAVKIIQFVSQNLPMFVNAALQIILALANGLAESLPELVPTITECVMTIVQTLMAPENVTLLMDAAIALMQGLGQGLINAVPVLAQNLPTLVMNMVQALIAQAPKMFQIGPQFVAQMSLGFATAIGNLANQLKAWVKSKIIDIVKSMASKMSPSGAALVEGLWKGISDKMAWMKAQISKWVSNIIEFFKNLLGIHSPSTVFEKLGQQTMAGYIRGINEGMSGAQDALSAIPGANGSIDASPYGMGGSVINIYPQQLDNGTMDYIFARVNSRMGAAI